MPNGKYLFGSKISVVGLTPNQTMSGAATNLVGKKLAHHYAFYQGIPYSYIYDSDNTSNTENQPCDIGFGIDTSQTQTIAIIKY